MHGVDLFLAGCHLEVWQKFMQIFARKTLSNTIMAEYAHTQKKISSIICSKSCQLYNANNLPKCAIVLSYYFLRCLTLYIIYLALCGWIGTLPPLHCDPWPSALNISWFLGGCLWGPIGLTISIADGSHSDTRFFHPPSNSPSSSNAIICPNKTFSKTKGQSRDMYCMPFVWLGELILSISPRFAS